MEKEKKVVVGFWFRLLSDVIDAIILAILGFLLAIPFKGFLYSLGENGLFIGLFITFLYAGILQSHVGNGQSLAKKLLKIQVLKIDGSYLSLPKSFFRYSVIALIFYNSWIWMALTSIAPFLNNAIFQSVFFYFIVILFFGVTVFLMLHPLKRGVHDLISNSVVVRKSEFDETKIADLNDKSKIKKAFLIWGGCCVVLVALSFYLLLQQKDSTSILSELGELQKTITQQTDFKNITVKHNWHTQTNSEGVVTKATSINIFPFLKKNKFDDETQRLEEIKDAVEIVVNSYSKLSECDYINVQVRTGFNIGIASLYMRETKSFDIEGNLLLPDKK